MRWLDATPPQGGAEGPRNLHLACSKHIQSSPPTQRLLSAHGAQNASELRRLRWWGRHPFDFDLVSDPAGWSGVALFPGREGVLGRFPGPFTLPVPARGQGIVEEIADGLAAGPGQARGAYAGRGGGVGPGDAEGDGGGDPVGGGTGPPGR